jgi:3'(2'), 5'-bisphosphate nucleotidase
MWNDKQLDAVKDIALAAGAEILDVYHQNRPIDVTLKADDSPLTEADRRADRVIAAGLAELPGSFPILSEESFADCHEDRQQWQRYWLVDPLDGTKEFVKRNGEFTVNIALIENGVAVLGVVHVPVTGVTYLGKAGCGAWKLEGSGEPSGIHCSAAPGHNTRLRVVASRSHRDQRLDAMLELLAAEFGETTLVSMGSSLKICLLAEGAADIYPRLAPTSEWDTAAAHAVLRAAGGDIVDTSFQSLAYNKKHQILNPFFIGLADPSYPWQCLLAPALDKPD